MLLYIIRHAWAEERDEDAFPDDEHRPLTKEGRKRFRKLVKALAERGFAPVEIATSPLVRCVETAEIIAEVVPSRPQVTLVEALSPGSKLDALIEWTRQRAGGDVAWVGHAPDVGRLTAALIGDPYSAIRFTKGAVAAIEFDRPPAPGQGELAWLVSAKLVLGES
jgi:phosphohistidine phosphatase